MRALVIALLSISELCWAQSFDWTSGAAGTLDDKGKSVCTDGKGNFFVAGEFDSPTIRFGDYTLTNNDTTGNSSDIFVVKYDSDGKVLWAIAAGGDKDEKVNCICADRNGNCYITGYFESIAANFGTNRLNQANIADPRTDIFIAKYGSSGKPIMAIAGHGDYHDFGNAICTDTKGNFYVTGLCSTTLKFGSYTLKSYGGGMFVSKHDSTGKVLWAKTAGGALENEGKSICADDNGNCYVTGIFHSAVASFGTFKLKNYTTNTGDLFVTKYDSTGKVTWATSAGGLNDDPGYGIACDAAGNCYVAGSFLSLNLIIGKDTLIRNAYSDNIFIAKFDATGKAAWARSYDGSSCGTANSIYTDATGNSIITGTLKKNWQNQESNTWKQLDDVFVVKYDASGKIVWALNSTEASLGEGKSICADINGDIYVTGSFETEKINFGKNTLINTDTKGNSRDFFFVKIKK
jgi:hypothetical protein